MHGHIGIFRISHINTSFVDGFFYCVTLVLTIYTVMEPLEPSVCPCPSFFPLVLLVYHCRLVPLVHKAGWGAIWTIFPVEFIDPQVIVQGYLHGKVEHVRKIGSWSNKIKQMRKQNIEYTQYNRDTDLRGSPNVGYVHQRNCQVLPLLLSSIWRDTTYNNSSSFSYSLLSQNTIFAIHHSRNTFPS